MARTRVLVIDDEASIRSALLSVLEQSEIDAEGADTAEKAIIRLGNQPPVDLVLVDKNLPGKSGVDLIRWIRTTDQSLPVVMMTAYPSAESVKHTLNLGIDAYLEKPFPDIFAVAEVVRGALQKRRTGFTAPPVSAGPALPPAAEAAPESGGGAAVIAAAPDDGGKSMAGPFESAGVPVIFSAPREALIATIEQARPGFVVLEAGNYRTDLAPVVKQVRKAVPMAACIVVSAEELGLSVLRSLLHLGVKGLYTPENYAHSVAELLGKRPA